MLCVYVCVFVCVRKYVRVYVHTYGWMDLFVCVCIHWYSLQVITVGDTG